MLTKKWFWLLIFFAVLVGTFPLWRVFPGTFLLMEDELKRADCIVVLRGDAFFRFKKAAELFQGGYADSIVLSPLPERRSELGEYYQFKNRVLGVPDVTVEEYVERAFEFFGQDTNKVHLTDVEVTSTFDEAVATKAWMLERGRKSFILVTNGYHMRRAMIIFGLVFRNTGIRIYPVTANDSIHHPQYWWQRERDVKSVFGEYLAIGFNLIYHFLLQKGTTSFDTY